MAEFRLNTYFLVPTSAINTPINIPYFAWDNEGVIEHYTMAQMQTLWTRYVDPNQIADIEPSRNYTDGFNYTLDEIDKLFNATDFPRNADGNIEYVIFPQTMHPSIYKDFINELNGTLGYSTYGDKHMMDWDSIDVFLKASSL